MGTVFPVFPEGFSAFGEALYEVESGNCCCDAGIGNISVHYGQYREFGGLCAE